MAGIDSDEEAARDFARLLVEDRNHPSRVLLAQGTVSAVGRGVDEGRITIYLSGDTTTPIADVRYLDSYVPKVNDVVWCARWGPDLWVLGDFHKLQDPLSGFQPLALNSPWTAYGAPYETGRYWKDPEGWVYVQAVLKGGTLGTSMATLPSLYRPQRLMNFAGLCGPGASGALITVDTGGNIVATRVEAGGNNSFVSFVFSFMDANYANIGPTYGRNEWVPVPPIDGWNTYSQGYWPAVHTRDDGFSRAMGGIAGGTAYTGGVIIPERARAFSRGLWQVPCNNAGAYQSGRIDTGRTLLTPGGGSNTEMWLDALHWWPWWAEYQSGISASGWVNNATANGWTFYDNDFNNPGSRRDKYGVAHYRGMVKGGTATAGTAIISSVSYKPSMKLIFPAGVVSGTGRVDVDTTGAIQYQVGGNSYMSLDHIMFRDES